MYTDEVRRYEVCLDGPAKRRWSAVIDGEKEVAEELIEEVQEDLRRIPAHLRALAMVARPLLSRFVGTPLIDEIVLWASELGYTIPDLVLANCAYEVSHVVARALRPFGCTAGILKTKNGPVHVRNLDWPVEALGPATVLLDYTRGGATAFVAVGVVGLVGVLSGMVPGEYSVSLNWAPPTSLPKARIGPAFLLRQVLEECDTFADAVSMLSTTRLATSAFFMVCGRTNEQAVVVERTPNKYAVRRSGGRVMAQANHFETREFKRYNACGNQNSRADSIDRAYQLLCAMSEFEGSRVGAESAAGFLDEDPILNDETVQQMVFTPRDSKMLVWRRE